MLLDSREEIFFSRLVTLMNVVRQPREDFLLQACRSQMNVFFYEVGDGKKEVACVDACVYVMLRECGTLGC